MSLAFLDIINTPDVVAKKEAYRLLRNKIDNIALSANEKTHLKKSIQNKIVNLNEPYRSQGRVVVPLVHAIYMVNLDAVRYLIEQNADVNAIVRQGKSLFDMLIALLPTSSSLIPPFSMEYSNNALKIALLVIPYLDDIVLEKMIISRRVLSKCRVMLEDAIQSELERRR